MGTQLGPCPCGCRSGPLAIDRLRQKGLFGVLVQLPSPHAKSLEQCRLRHAHPWELAVLNGVLPCRYEGNIKLALTGLGQIASPLQVTWLVSQIQSHLQKQHVVKASDPICPKAMLWKQMLKIFKARDQKLPMLAHYANAVAFKVQCEQVLAGPAPAAHPETPSYTMPTGSEHSAPLFGKDGACMAFSIQKPSQNEGNKQSHGDTETDRPHDYDPIKSIACAERADRPDQVSAFSCMPPGGQQTQVQTPSDTMPLGMSPQEIETPCLTPVPATEVDTMEPQMQSASHVSFRPSSESPSLKVLPPALCGAGLSEPRGDEIDQPRPGTKTRECGFERSDAWVMDADHPLKRFKPDALDKRAAAHSADPIQQFEIACIEVVRYGHLSQVKLQGPATIRELMNAEQSLRGHTQVAITNAMGEEAGLHTHLAHGSRWYVHDREHLHIHTVEAHPALSLHKPSRLQLLHTQQAWVASDEIYYYLDMATQDGRAHASPPFVHEALKIKAWLATLCKGVQGKPVVSAVLLKGHWHPVHLQVQSTSFVLTTTPGLALHLTEHDGCVQMPSPLEIRCKELQSRFKADCGFQTVAWICAQLHPNEPESTKTVADAIEMRRTFEDFLCRTLLPSQRCPLLHLGGAQISAQDRAQSPFGEAWSARELGRPAM